MYLKQLGPNKTEIGAGDARVLFSYQTPVAALIHGKGWFRTEKKWSRTTSRHINQWIRGLVTARPQEWFNNLLQVTVNETNGGE